MQIFVLYPMCLILALAKFGSQNEFFVLDDLTPSSRIKGRNVGLRESLLIRILGYLEIPFKKISTDSLSDILANSSKDIAVDFQLAGRFFRLGLLPLDKNSHRKIFLLSFGADNLLPFGKKIEAFRSLKSFKEIHIWKNFFRNLRADFLVIPSIRNLPQKSYSNTELITISLDDLKSNLYDLIKEMVVEILDSNKKLKVNQLIILSPDNSSFNKEHLLKIVAEANQQIFKFEGECHILYKPHPATNAEISELHFVEFHLGFQTLNSIAQIDLETLKAIPLEFFLIAFPNTYYVGAPTSSLSLLPQNQFSLVKTFNRELDRLLLRSYKTFFALHGITKEANRSLR